MPFSLTNRPATFQQFINDILGNMLDVCVIGYLDDILIYSKCKFHTDTIEYLGFIMSPEGLRMDPAKVTMILEWPEPRNVKDIQSFLGFANFYR